MHGSRVQTQPGRWILNGDKTRCKPSFWREVQSLARVVRFYGMLKKPMRLKEILQQWTWIISLLNFFLHLFFHLFDLLMASPVMWNEEHLQNLSVVQGVHLLSLSSLTYCLPHPSHPPRSNHCDSWTTRIMKHLHVIFSSISYKWYLFSCFFHCSLFNDV
jgi:hypothetical protein